MAERFVYETFGRAPYVHSATTEFEWFAGFSAAQKRRCISSLHEAYLRRHPGKKVERSYKLKIRLLQRSDDQRRGYHSCNNTEQDSDSSGHNGLSCKVPLGLLDTEAVDTHYSKFCLLAVQEYVCKIAEYHG